MHGYILAHMLRVFTSALNNGRKTPSRMVSGIFKKYLFQKQMLVVFMFVHVLFPPLVTHPT